MAITGINTNGASSAEAWSGGEGNLTLGGDFGGGRARIEFSTDTGFTWYPVEDHRMETLLISRNRSFNVHLPACIVRVFVVGADEGSLNINLTLTAL